MLWKQRPIHTPGLVNEKVKPLVAEAVLVNFQALSEQIAWVRKDDDVTGIGIWSLKKRMNSKAQYLAIVATLVYAMWLVEDFCALKVVFRGRPAEAEENSQAVQRNCST